MIDFDRDSHQNLLIYIGDTHTIVIRWYRQCPFGCTGYYNAEDWPFDEVCPICHDEQTIPWYRGWVNQARMEWQNHVESRFYDWWMIPCPRCEDNPDLPDPFILNNSCALCDGSMYIGRGKTWGWKLDGLRWYLGEFSERNDPAVHRYDKDKNDD